jgi:myo-inositol-1(or 4)-monophosphatase
LPDGEGAAGGHEGLVERNDDLELLIGAAKEAGRIALGFFKQDPKAWTKAGDSPVTEADIASDRSLHGALTTARPDYGWLSEETADTPSRLSNRRVFIVDPIDGTRGFIEGNPDWCVSVAIVEDGVPIVGVLFVPAREELFEAVLGGGARLNGVPLHFGEPADLTALRLAGPIRHLKAFTKAGLGIVERRYTPSLAFRIALVASNRVDLATARADANDWDLAAVDLLVHEAGGILCDLDGARLSYNQPDPRHPALIAAAPHLARTAARLVADAEVEAHQDR